MIGRAHDHDFGSSLLNVIPFIEELVRDLSSCITTFVTGSISCDSVNHIHEDESGSSLKAF